MQDFLLVSDSAICSHGDKFTDCLSATELVETPFGTSETSFSYFSLHELHSFMGFVTFVHGLLSSDDIEKNPPNGTKDLIKLQAYEVTTVKLT